MLFKYLKIAGVVSTFSFGSFIFFKIYQIYSFEYVDIFILLLSYFCADVFSGFVHWVGDTFGDESNTLWGEQFVTPFRVHHRDPTFMTKIPVWENLGASCMLALLPQSTLFYFILEAPHSVIYAKIYLFFNTLFVLTAITNFFHRYAHTSPRNTPDIIKWLQRHHLILNPKSHQIHHRSPYDTYFGVTNGWSNKLLEKIKFWSFMRKLFKAR